MQTLRENSFETMIGERLNKLPNSHGGMIIHLWDAIFE